MLGLTASANSYYPLDGLIYFINKYSIDFDGVDDRIITNGADTVLQNTTYSFWAKTTTTGINLVFAHGYYRRGGFAFNWSLDRPILRIGEDKWIMWNDNSAQDDGEWHHWVVYLNAGNITESKLYVDATLQTVSATSNTGSIDAYTTSLIIGNDGGAFDYTGKIDEFAVYDRELTQAEITRMYNSYYTTNLVQNGNFDQIGLEEVTNGDFSQIGSELVTNGDFATSGTPDTGSYTLGWYSNTDGVEIANGKLTLTNSASGDERAYATDGVSSNSILTTNKIYKLTFDITDNTNCSIFQIYKDAGTFVSVTNTVGSYTYYITNTSNSLFIFRNNTVNSSISLDNVSIKEVGQDWTFFGEAEFTSLGARIYSSSGGQSYIKQTALTNTKSYKLTYEITDSTQGSLKLINVNGLSDFPITSTVGTHTVYFIANNNEFFIYRNSGITDVTIDNISVKEVGQHWTFGTGWATDGTKAIFSGTDFYNLTPSNTPLLSGRDYKVTLKAEVTNGSFKFQNNGVDIITGSSTGDYTATFTSGSNTFNIARAGVGVQNDFTIDNIVVQELKHDATNLMLNAGDYQSASPLLTSTKSMDFDGTDDFLKVEDSANLRGMAALTVCCWVKVDSKSNYAKVLDYSSTSGNSQRKYRIQLDSSTDQKISFLIANTSDSTSIVTSTNPVQTDRWVHLVGTFDNSLSSNRQSLYIDGVLDNTATAFTETINNDDSGFLSFGENTYGSNNFNGQITEAGIYNRALTSLEVASLYNQGVPTDLLVNRNNYQSGNPTVFNTKQVDFDGVDDYLNAGDVLNLGTEDFSISCWLNSSQSTNYTIGKTQDDGNRWYFRTTGNRFQFHSKAGGSVLMNLTTTETFPVDTWVHLLISADRDGTVYLYINGVQSSVTAAGSATSLDNTGNLTIGRVTFFDSYFDGKISQVGMWNKALTADEVSSLYNHGLPIDLTTDQAAYQSSSNLVGYWRMGSGTLDTYPLIADQTNATLGNSIWDGASGSTTGWTNFGNNTHAPVDGALKITYVDNSAGVYIYLRDANQLSTDLTVGKTYKINFDSKVESGQVEWKVQVSGGDTYSAPKINSTDYVNVTLYIVAYSTNSHYLFPRQYDSAASVFIKNIKVQEVQGNPAIMTNQTSSDIENGSPYANLVQNSDFATDSDWTLGTGWSIEDGKASCDGTGALSSQNIIDQNKTYLVSFDVVNYTSGDIRSVFSADGGTYSENINSVGTYTRFIRSSTTSGQLQFFPNPSFNGSIDNVSVEEVNTGLQGYWKMGDGTNDEYPVIYDQVDPTLGSELVTNGDFSDGTNNWTETNAVISVSNNQLTVDDSLNLGGDSRATQTFTTENGKSYILRFDRISTTSLFWLGIGNGANYNDIFYSSLGTDTGAYARVFTASGTTSTIALITGGTGISVFSNVTIKEMSGNFAEMTNMVEGNITNQYPLTKIRNYYRMGDGNLDGYPIIQDQTSPNLAHIPTTNLITYSEDFSQWSANDVTLESGYASPDGGNNAWKVTNTGANAHLVGYNGINTNKHKSIYARTVSGTGYVYLLCRTGNASALYNLSENWQRFDMQHIGSDFFYAVDFRSTTDLTEVLIFGAQLEEQSQATPYLKSDGIAAVRKSSTTNLFEYSESFNNTSWVKSSVTIVDNSSQSPNGTNNASLMYPISNGNYRYIHNSTTTSSASIYTISAFVKASGKNVAWFYINSSGDNGLIYFDLNDETIEVVAGSSGTPTGTITPYDNGWYKITFTSGNAFILNSGSGVGVSDAKGNPAVTANNEDGILVWGLQLEAQTQAETYAKTTGLPVTIDLFTENNYGTMTNMSASDIVEDTP